jgi:hypothetical protein
MPRFCAQSVNKVSADRRREPAKNTTGNRAVPDLWLSFAAACGLTAAIRARPPKQESAVPPTPGIAAAVPQPEALV